MTLQGRMLFKGPIFAIIPSSPHTVTPVLHTLSVSLRVGTPPWGLVPGRTTECLACCFGIALGCLFLNDYLVQFHMRNILESNGWSRELALCSMEAIRPTLWPTKEKGRTRNRHVSAPGMSTSSSSTRASHKVPAPSVRIFWDWRQTFMILFLAPAWVGELGLFFTGSMRNRK
jgi:hypothetical protein